MESAKYQTFFDIGIDANDDRPFAKLLCVNFTDKKKKRIINNELIKRYFNGDSISKDELIKVKKILDGSIYSDRRKLYSHCKLCSNEFERIPLINYSAKYKYWELCIPTFPYFPCGLMVYLKDRENNHIENFQDLPDDYIKELVNIQNELLVFLQNRFLGNDLVGVNILFNQISKSELCIHGHIELMINDLDDKNLGCSYVLERPFDRFTNNINRQIPSDSSILKIPEGIKINYFNTDISDIKSIMKLYEKIINYYFNRGKDLQENLINVETNEDLVLKSNMIPAVVDFVYLTCYRNKQIISMVPSITSDFVPLSDISNDPIELYSLIINRHYSNENNVFMRNYSPLIRPSIKICAESSVSERVKILEKVMYKELGK